MKIEIKILPCLVQQFQHGGSWIQMQFVSISNCFFEVFRWYLLLKLWCKNSKNLAQRNKGDLALFTSTIWMHFHEKHHWISIMALWELGRWVGGGGAVVRLWCCCFNTVVYVLSGLWKIRPRRRQALCCGGAYMLICCCFFYSNPGVSNLRNLDQPQCLHRYIESLLNFLSNLWNKQDQDRGNHDDSYPNFSEWIHTQYASFIPTKRKSSSEQTSPVS